MEDADFVKRMIRYLSWGGGLIVVIAVALGWYIHDGLTPPEVGDQVLVDIPKGAGTRQIASILAEHHLIKNPLVFGYYVKSKGVGSQLQAGRYQLRQGDTIDQILQKMTAGDVYRDTFKITIREGWTVEQIAAYLEAKGVADGHTFRLLAKEGNFTYPFLPEKSDKMKYRLEGFLFPDTYIFEKNATENMIITRMLEGFQEHWRKDWDKVLTERHMSILKAVTLASIVEREAVVDKERPLISGVFYNRLKKHMLLQADSTVQYALGGEQKERLFYKDLEVDSPYNTYKYTDLPPGPIGNPGMASLEAVINPAKTDYYFFVTKKDGSQEHYFAKTYEDHQKNIALSNAQAKK
jgi:UPF0755 protein